MNAIYLGLLWMLYYFLHSALASNGVKAFLKNSIPAVYPYYRAFYTFFAVVNFVLLLLLHFKVPSALIFRVKDWYIWPAGALIGAGTAVTAIAVHNYGLDFFYREKSADAQSHELKTGGINSFVRHPLYFGLLLMLAGVFIYTPTWKNAMFIAITTVYIVIGALVEENKLIGVYGDDYIAYRKRVKMLIPYVF